MGKRQINPPLLHFFWSAKAVKRCKSWGVICILPPHSYTILPPLADQKRCKSGGLIWVLPPHSYTILPPLEAQCSPKRVLSCIFLKNPPIAAPLLRNFTPWQPNSYIILLPPPPGSPTLTSFNPLNLLAPIPEDCQSWTHNLCTLSCVALSSRPSMLVQLLTVYIYK